jgi:hypothetical protein
VTGTISSAGATGTVVSIPNGAGGNGASGSILLKGYTVTLGASLVSAPYSSGTGASYHAAGAGGGSLGRIAVGAVNTPTGSTNPSYTSVSAP